MTMDTFEQIADLIRTILTSVAIITGGLWAAYRFRRHRQARPRAQLEFEHTSTFLSPEKRLLHVGLVVANTGNVLLKVKYAELRVRQVVPPPAEILDSLEPDFDPIPMGSKEFPWPMIVRREWSTPSWIMELEPSESDSLHADFVLESEVAVVELYAYVGNSSKSNPDIGWTRTAIVHFKKEPE